MSNWASSRPWAAWDNSAHFFSSPFLFPSLADIPAPRVSGVSSPCNWAPRISLCGISCGIPRIRCSAGVCVHLCGVASVCVCVPCALGVRLRAPIGSPHCERDVVAWARRPRMMSRQRRCPTAAVAHLRPSGGQKAQPWGMGEHAQIGG